jgi:hypothetical protein
MWIKFVSSKPYAIRLFVGSVNAISGETISQSGNTQPGNTPNQAVQDYVVVPNQLWIDGIATSPGVVRQFVAMPVGSGYSVEAQVTGRENLAGILFSVTRALNALTLSVKFENRSEFTIETVRESTVNSLKSIIQNEIGIEPSHQRLVYQGARLFGNGSVP